MTKSHRIHKKLLSRLPSLLAPVVLTCALSAAATAQESNSPAADKGQNAQLKNSPASNAAPTTANRQQANAESARADDEDTDGVEENGATPKTQAGVESNTNALPVGVSQAPYAGPADRQPNSILQSERIKARPAPNPQQTADPASRARSRQKRLEALVRGVMTQAGFSDLSMQGYIAAHMANEDQARGPLRKKGEQLFLALKSVRVTSVQIDELLREFQKALDDDKQRRLQCEANLDAKIGYSKNARLQAVLVLFGIIGDGALFVPLREPPRPRQSVPVRSDAPAPVPQQDGTAMVVSTTAAATVAEVARTAPEQGQIVAPQADATSAKPATYDAGTAPAVSKDRSSFK